MGQYLLRTRCHPTILRVYLYSVTYFTWLVTGQSQSSSMTIASTVNSIMTLVSQDGVFEEGFSSQARLHLAAPVDMLATW